MELSLIHIYMYATDVDPIESAKTKKRLADAGFGEDILTIRLQNFCTIDELSLIHIS